MKWGGDLSAQRAQLGLHQLTPQLRLHRGLTQLRPDLGADHRLPASGRPGGVVVVGAVEQDGSQHHPGHQGQGENQGAELCQEIHRAHPMRAGPDLLHSSAPPTQ